MSYKIIDNKENEELFVKIVKNISEGKNYNMISEEIGKSKDFVYSLVKFYKKKHNINSSVISKYDYYKLTGEIDNIVSLYNEGKSTEFIGKTYNASDRAVVSWLKRENVNIRDRGIISKINQTIFDNIDTEIKAYTLGLLTSDGNVQNKSSTITICLTNTDGYILEKINEELLSGLGNILVTHKEDEKPRKVLSFNGKHLKDKLAEYNIVPRKSYIIKELSTKIPEELYHHYIRGLFDGDGVCSYETSHKKKKVRIGFCGHNRDFVENYRNFLINKLDMNQTKLFNTGGCWQCSWSSKKDLINFYNYIYKDATIFLGRKKKKISDYVNTEVT